MVHFPHCSTKRRKMSNVYLRVRMQFIQAELHKTLEHFYNV